MNADNPEHANLTKLGEGGTQPKRELETFPNRNPERDYIVELETSEFSCLCPKTGQPDFAEILIRYVPDQKSWSPNPWNSTSGLTGMRECSTNILQIYYWTIWLGP